MELALAGRTLGTALPLEEDIRLAAITGYPWLVLDIDKLAQFLAQPDLDIRDLKRLFLRTQPAAVDGLHLPDSAPDHAPEVERWCKEARRVGAPVLVLRPQQVDERLARLADIAKQWSVVLALAPSETCPVGRLRAVVRALNHEALGFYLDLVSLWRAGERPQPEDAARTALLAVGDVSAQGRPVLPGEGILPLGELLAPLHAGGYNSLAVLALEGVEPPPNPEAMAGAGLTALATQLARAGWAVADA